MDPLFGAGFPAFLLIVALVQAAEHPLHSWAGVSPATGSPQITSGTCQVITICTVDIFMCALFPAETKPYPECRWLNWSGLC